MDEERELENEEEEEKSENKEHLYARDAVEPDEGMDQWERWQQESDEVTDREIEIIGRYRASEVISEEQEQRQIERAEKKGERRKTHIQERQEKFNKEESGKRIPKQINEICPPELIDVLHMSLSRKESKLRFINDLRSIGITSEDLSDLKDDASWIVQDEKNPEFRESRKEFREKLNDLPGEDKRKFSKKMKEEQPEAWNIFEKFVK